MTPHAAPIALPDVRPSQHSSHGPEADALLSEVRAALDTLASLLAHGEGLGDEVVTAIRAARQDVEARLFREELRVVLVGERGSGKSSLLDALMGEQLLGRTSTPPHVVTTLRRGTERRYRAKFANGTVEQFVPRSSEASAELERSLVLLEAQREDANRARDLARAELAEAIQDDEQAERALTDAFRDFEGGRLKADELGFQLQQIEREAERLEQAVAQSQSELPRVLCTKPARWAFWLWLLRLSLLLFAWARYRRHQQLLVAEANGQSERTRVRMATSQAAEAVNGLQTALEAANAPVERARARAEAARKSSLEAERRARELEDQGERLKVELTRRANEGQRRFASELAQLFGPSPPGKLLLELELAHPGELLPESVALIDVPLGFEENAVAEQRAWSTIRKQADACILVSELDRAVSGKTKAVLQQLREIVVHVILVLTKLDQAVREAERRGAGDPAESVEQARKIGTRRFAREVGRDPSEVLSIAVSAHEALTTDQDARRRMEAEVRKLFMLLRRERALILGSRSAGIVRSCIAAATEAEQRAERAYLERIATLEAGRRPEPEQLRRALLQAAEPLLQAAAERVQASGADIAADSVRLIQLECASSIEACRDKTELTAVASRLAQLITTGFTRARDAVRDHLAVEGDRALARIEADAYGKLRQRYDLIHEVTRAEEAELGLDASLPAPEAKADLALAIAERFRAASRLRRGFGLLGATLPTIKRECIASVQQTIAELAQDFEAQVAGATPELNDAMRRVLDESLAQALTRFSRWIAEPLAAEREAIRAERDKLADLHTLIAGLELHDDRLESLGKAAVDASLGLCR